MKCRGSWKCWNTSISHNLPFSLLIPDFEMVNSGTGREWKISIPKVREREGNEKKGKGIKKIHSQNLGTGREWKKTFPKFGNGKGMKKSIPKVRERESEASILGNDREREFPLTPVFPSLARHSQSILNNKSDMQRNIFLPQLLSYSTNFLVRGQ